MENKRKIAFFDFCETLVDFQTADAFVDFVRNKTTNKRMLRLERLQRMLKKIQVIRVAEKLTGNKKSLNKRLKLYQLRGLDHIELDKYARLYFNEIIKKHYIDTLLDALIQKKKSGYEIVLVSGGYDVYLKYFSEEYGVDNLISTKIGFKEDICTGKFDGMDCLFENKVTLLNNEYHKDCLYCCAYSDSKTDLPFLKWADEAYVVSKNTSQKWAKANNFKEIVWTEKNS